MLSPLAAQYATDVNAVSREIEAPLLFGAAMAGECGPGSVALEMRTGKCRRGDGRAESSDVVILWAQVGGCRVLDGGYL